MDFGDPRLPASFWAKCTPEPNSGCWLWFAGASGGYGAFTLDGRSQRAHRITFEASGLDIPPGFVIDHKCRVTLCCNPAHLSATTLEDNIRLGTRRKTPRTHCKHGHDFTEANTVKTTRGHRVCRTCTNARSRRTWAQYGEKYNLKRRRA